LPASFPAQIIYHIVYMYHNMVTLCRALQLVLRWVIVLGHVSPNGIQPATQVNSAWPSLHG